MSPFGMQVLLKGGQLIGLAFRSVEAAVAAKAKLAVPAVPIAEISDDFGSVFTVLTTEISGVLIMDEDGAGELGVLRGLQQARMNQRAQKMAQTDSELNGGIVPAREIIVPGRRN